MVADPTFETEGRGPLADALALGPVMADGGMSTALAELGASPSGPLWTAEVLATQPQLVGRAHEAFLDAGARVILSAGYQVSRRGAVATGRSPADGDLLLVDAVRVARRARSAWAERCGARGRRRGGDAWVAASIGPYGATLADGSEYRGNYDCSEHELRGFHRQRLSVLCEAGVERSTRAELWWCETIPDGREVRVLADELERAMARMARLGAPPPELIVSMTVGADARCVTGEPVAEAIAPVLDLPGLVAVGVNCAPGEHVAAALRPLAAATAVPLVAKPNLGGAWDPARGVFVGASSSSGRPDALLEQLLDAGARLVGGCCGSGPGDLAQMARALAGVR
ncbi:MAG: homocysteine S-methyltransferase [Microthrixaceae bacterium]